MANEKEMEKNLEEKIDNFEEEVKKVGKKVSEEVKKNMNEKNSWLQRTLGVLYPLLTSLIGLIILGIGIVSIEMLNLALGTSFLFSLHAFLINNLEILFLALLVASYGSYLEKKFKDLHLVTSPLITSFGITVFLWVLASIVGMLNISLGRYHSIGISNLILSNLGNIFVVFAIIGYVALMMKKNKRELKRNMEDNSGKEPENQEDKEKEVKRLYRSGKDKLLGGVCSGIAEYLKTDPVLIRLLWVAMVLLWGFGVVLYVIAWIVIPRNPKHNW